MIATSDDRTCSRKIRIDERDGDAFLDELVLEVIDRTLDQGRAIVDRDDLDASGQTPLQFGELGLHPIDDLQRVLAVAHDDHAGHGLALAIQFDDTAPQRWPLDHARHVRQQHGRAVLSIDDDVLEIRLFSDVARRANHVLALALLEYTSADLTRCCAHRLHDSAQRNIVGSQPIRIDQYLVLAHEAAHRRDFGHTLDARQLELEEPILQGAQFGQIRVATLVDQGVLIDPADAGRVRADLRHRTGRQLGAESRQRLEYP